VIAGIVIAHGNFAEALVSAAEKILGPSESLIPVSNEGYSLKDLTIKIESLILDNAKSDGICIMSEFKGGSCFIAAKKACMQAKKSIDLSFASNIFLLTGLNMPMLITFISGRNSLSPPELAHAMKNEGIQGITIEELSKEN